jgi:hypothetical protein
MMNNSAKYRLSGLRFFLILLMVFPASAGMMGQKPLFQGKPVPANFCIKSQEMELYLMINAYRRQFDLPPIPLSKSLSYVAALHVKDLMIYHPDEGNCNFHSWSANGPWKAFCYPSDENKKQSVWDKPKEITKYPAKAWEIIYWENTELTPDSVMSVWKSEEYFNTFLLSNGKWLGQQWKSIGVAILGNYASAWFGLEPDPDGEAFVCGQKPPVPVHEETATVKKNEPSATPPPVKEIPVKAPADTTKVSTSAGMWYVIVKTNLSQSAAEKVINELKSAGYPDAQFLSSGGKTRISAFGPAEKTIAASVLKEIKKVYKDAWLLKQ